MQIHLARNNTPLGVFSDVEVREQLSRGILTGAEQARREGMTDWQPLHTILPPHPGQPPLPGSQVSSGPSPAVPVTSGLAIASLACGILGLPAIILGHIALSKIKRSQGALKGGGLATAGVVIGYVALLYVVSFLIPARGTVTNRANQIKGTDHCRQIISFLHVYASDNNGLFPDSVPDPITGKLPTTSNEAFRALFLQGVTPQEKIFGCPASRYQPDSNIGAAPTFDHALMPHENHWALTAGQSASSAGRMPLVFENPVSTSWPPKWNCDAAGKLVQGRAWPSGKVIVGNIDGSVEVIKLDASRGKEVGPKTLRGGGDIFTNASGGRPQNILQITLGGGWSHSNSPRGHPAGLPPPPPPR